MATSEQALDESQAFADAFAADEAPQTEMSEDEAFGLHEAESPAEEAAEPVQEPAAVESAEPVAEEGPMDTEAAESGADAVPDAVVVVTPEGDEGPTDPKELQRQKSWEGRLKAKEAELKAREDALKAPVAEEAGEAVPDEAAMTEVAAAVESGELTLDQAMATLGNAFGPEVTKMTSLLIESKARDIAGSLADEKVGAVRGEFDGLVNEIVEDKKRSHMEMISDAHPDFIETAGSPEFKAFIENLPGSEQEMAKQVIQSGTARQINKLLSTFKSAKTAEPEDTQAMDDAEGVRSSGLKIPEKPVMGDSYEDAWASFS